MFGFVNLTDTSGNELYVRPEAIRLVKKLDNEGDVTSYYVEAGGPHFFLSEKEFFKLLEAINAIAWSSRKGNSLYERDNKSKK